MQIRCVLIVTCCGTDAVMSACVRACVRALVGLFRVALLLCMVASCAVTPCAMVCVVLYRAVVMLAWWCDMVLRAR